MPELSGLPQITKYTPGDSVFIIQDFKILPVMIASWRVEVRNPLSDLEGMQVTRYSFIERPDLEVIESLVFASENACLAWMKNDYINRAIESTTGGHSFFSSGIQSGGAPRSFGNWTDFAGWDMALAKFIIDDEWIFATGTGTVGIGESIVVGTGTAFLTDYQVGDHFDFVGEFGADPAGLNYTITAITDDTHLSISPVTFFSNYTNRIVMKIAPQVEVTLLEESEGEKTLVFDYTNLLNAVLPDSISDPSSNWAAFRANVRSYDAETTIMPDGDPIGRP